MLSRGKNFSPSEDDYIKKNNPQNNSSENLEWLSPEQHRAKH